MKRLLHLNPKKTQLALLNRHIYSIECCGRHMEQIDVRGECPSSTRPFAYSQIVLECRYCERQIVLTVLNAFINRKLIQEYIS